MYYFFFFPILIPGLSIIPDQVLDQLNFSRYYCLRPDVEIMTSFFYSICRSGSFQNCFPMRPGVEV